MTSYVVQLSVLIALPTIVKTKVNNKFPNYLTQKISCLYGEPC